MTATKVESCDRCDNALIFGEIGLCGTCQSEVFDDGPTCDNCPAPAPFVNGKPKYPVCHGSSLGLCAGCVADAFNFGTA